MRLGNDTPGKTQVQRKSAKTGNTGHFPSSSFLFPLHTWRWRQEFRCCVISERSNSFGKIARLIYNLQVSETLH